MKLLLMMFLMSSSSWAKDAIFLIRGNIVDSHGPIHREAEKIIEGHVAQTYPNALFENVHNHKWQEVCETLVQLDNARVLERVVLIGHSWGAQVSWTTSRCLHEKTGRDVELVIAMDPVQKPFHQNVRIVPFSVKKAFTASQPDGFWYQRGARNFKRPDGSHDGIEFRALNFYGQTWPHDRVLYQLAVDGTIERLLAEILN